MPEEKKNQAPKQSETKEFNVSLRNASQKGKPDIERANRAIAELFKFFKKNYRKERKQVMLAKEVNHKIWENSNHIPNKIQLQAFEKDGKLRVYLKDSQELKAELENAKKKEAEKKNAPAKTQHPVKETKEQKVEEKPAEEKKESKGKKQ